MMMLFNNMEIYPTDVCQLACSLCKLNKGRHSMGLTELKKIASSKILSMVKYEISILGGEPTKWKYLACLIEMARYFNPMAKITITTNAIESIRNDVISSAMDFGAKFNVSWHDIASETFFANLSRLHKNNLLDKIIIVPSTDNYKNLDAIANKLKMFGKVVFRPVVGGKDAHMMIKKLNEPLSSLSNYTIESSKRIVNYNKSDNIKIVTDAANDPDYYRKFCCKCGKNGVMFYDGKVYSCLSQAMASNNSHSINYIKKRPDWMPCEYDFCSCDTFELKKKDDK